MEEDKDNQPRKARRSQHDREPEAVLSKTGRASEECPTEDAGEQVPEAVPPESHQPLEEYGEQTGEAEHGRPQSQVLLPTQQRRHRQTHSPEPGHYQTRTASKSRQMEKAYQWCAQTRR